MRGRSGAKVAILLMLAWGGCGPDSPPPQHRAEGKGGSGPLPVLALEIRYTYRDLNRAWAFYSEVLGFPTVADHGLAKILQVSSSSYLTLMDASLSPHSPEDPKTVTLAVVTEEVEGWWEYLQGQGVPVHTPLKGGKGQPHDGFVVLDPEGYFLEFERFNPHPENALLLARLKRETSLYPPAGGDLPAGREGGRPRHLGVQATVVWLYYRDLSRMEAFWTEALDRPVLVDQGWAKVVDVAPTGFLGLVDGSRGLHQATLEKAVVLAFLTPRPEAWKERLAWVPGFALRLGAEPPPGFWMGEGVIGTDPEDYFLEWSFPRDFPGNRTWIRSLGLEPGTGFF